MCVTKTCRHIFGPLLTSTTSVFYLIEFIFAGKFLFIQLKKSHCLSKLLAQVYTKLRGETDKAFY